MLLPCYNGDIKCSDKVQAVASVYIICYMFILLDSDFINLYIIPIPIVQTLKTSRHNFEPAHHLYKYFLAVYTRQRRVE